MLVNGHEFTEKSREGEAVPINSKWNARLEKHNIVGGSVSILILEIALAVFVVRHWHNLSDLSRYSLVFLGFPFAVLWFCVIREKGKTACLIWTCIAFFAALD